MSIFTKIIHGEIPCYKIDETEQFIAFLDAFPLRAGHVLVVPKEEVDYIFDMDDELLSDLIRYSKYIAKAIDKSFDCARVGVSVIGLEVPHTHVHLIPMNSAKDLDFTQPKMEIEEAEMVAITNKIKANL